MIIIEKSDKLSLRQLRLEFNDENTFNVKQDFLKSIENKNYFCFIIKE
jgi:hypothetical protein